MINIVLNIALAILTYGSSALKSFTFHNLIGKVNKPLDSRQRCRGNDSDDDNDVDYDDGSDDDDDADYDDYGGCGD